MENALLNKRIYRRARFKGGIELDERRRPQQSFFQIDLDALLYTFVPNTNEAAYVGGIVADEIFVKFADPLDHTGETFREMTRQIADFLWFTNRESTATR
jgi:hypothetical protein